MKLFTINDIYNNFVCIYSSYYKDKYIKRVRLSQVMLCYNYYK